LLHSWQQSNKYTNKQRVSHASGPLFPTNTPAQRQRVMSQQQTVRKTYTEGEIYIAISDIRSKQIQSERRAAELMHTRLNFGVLNEHAEIGYDGAGGY
jgi:hypothetical protein